jgi:hypothetical protein
MKNLFLLIGFVAVAWFAADIAVNKFGLRFETDAVTAYGKITDSFGKDRPSATYEDDFTTGEVVLKYNPDRRRDADNYETLAKSPVRPSADRETLVQPRKKNADPSVVNVNEWVDRFTSLAFLEAQRKEILVPATLSLATGLYMIGQGERIETKEDFLSKVIPYLLDIKNKASQDERKAYFQYAANSDYWLQGMEKRGLNTREIKSLIARYNLKAYDEVVFENIAKKQLANTKVTRVATKTEKPVFVGTMTDKDAVRKHAAEVNKWVEKEMASSSHDLQFAAAGNSRPKSHAEARKAVAALQPGESMLFDNLDDFEMAVKELVALESGYKSWDAYFGKEPSKAKRQYRDRSNVMANGMEMRVTRR